MHDIHSSRLTTNASLGVLFAFCLSSCAFSNPRAPIQGSLAQDALPDSATALEAGDFILRQVFSDKIIEAQSPLVAKRHGELWVVYGTHNGLFGPSATVELDRHTGALRHVFHYGNRSDIP